MLSIVVLLESAQNKLFTEAIAKLRVVCLKKIQICNMYNIGLLTIFFIILDPRVKHF